MLSTRRATSSVARAVSCAELLHLVGHDREALARLAGAGGLDGRVEGEQVRLLGDGGDHLDHVADLGGGDAQPAHGLVGGGGRGDGVGGDVRRLDGVDPDLADGGAHLLGARRDRGHAVGDLLGGAGGGWPAPRRRRRRRSGGHLVDPPRVTSRSAAPRATADDLGEPLEGTVGVVPEPAHLALAGGVGGREAAGEVAAGDGREHGDGVGDGTGDAARDEHGDHDGDGGRGGAQQHHEHEEALADLADGDALGLVHGLLEVDEDVDRRRASPRTAGRPR